MQKLKCLYSVIVAIAPITSSCVLRCPLQEHGALSPYATRALALFTVPLENFTGGVSAPYSCWYGGGVLVSTLRYGGTGAA
jgi:hypothetical protein